MPWLMIGIFSSLPFYWGYLLYSTRPMLVYDAVGYVSMGRTIADQGFSAYFQASLPREPFFPSLLALALKLETLTSIPFPYYVKAELMLCLLLTMLGVFYLVRLMGSGGVAAGLAAFYVGVSPIILNSTLWLWSEAAALPWAVWGVVSAVHTWRSARDGAGVGWSSVLAVLTTLLFIGFTAVKASVAAVFLLFIIPFFIAAFIVLVRGSAGRAVSFLFAALLSAALFGATLEWYKLINLKANGSYALTNRVEMALYGNTVRRLQPLDKDKLNQAILSVPRLGFCEKYYGRACVYWSFQTSDAISERAIQHLTARGIPLSEQRAFFLKSSFELMLKNPLQQTGLCALEAAKMLFWENRLYFVKYPEWLAHIFSSMMFTYILCFTWVLFSLVSLLYAIVAWLKRGDMEALLVAWFIVCFMAAHSIFFVDIRYAVPIAPLFVALTFHMFSRIFYRPPPAPKVEEADFPVVEPLL